jgi:alpha-glucosidase
LQVCYYASHFASNSQPFSVYAIIKKLFTRNPNCKAMHNDNKHLWWKTAIIYQVYPRSFKDSNNDGVGDLKGITEKLDYLKWLGVDTIWISPIYPSPMKDFGYDISDYESIHPLFGNMEDFMNLVREIHDQDMKLILDLVPNHTSDEHPWFMESKSSRDNPKRDWYIWTDPKPNGDPPNNWLAAFGGKAWEWNEATGQYYMHSFLKEQPDLNWRNPEVERAVFDAMRFWLDKGVDGFRIDVMWHMIKDLRLRDNPPNPAYKAHMATYEELLPVYSTDQPEVHDVVKKMRNVLDEYEGRMMIGEIYLPIHKLVGYYGQDNNGAHLPFNFSLLFIAWQSQEIAAAIDQYEGAIPEGGWPNWVLGNHDQSRIVSRVGLQQARIAAMLLLTLRGTPTIYYGDEIGMTDVPIPAEEVQDPMGKNMPEKNLSRDPARTPMQWNSSPFGGFSEVKPWLRLDKTFARNNIERQTKDENSMLTLYRKLISLRKKETALYLGDYVPVGSDHQYIAYKRCYPEARSFLIILNLTHKPCYFNISGFNFKGTIRVATVPELEGMQIEDRIDLSGDEGIIVELE